MLLLLLLLILPSIISSRDDDNDLIICKIDERQFNRDTHIYNDRLINCTSAINCRLIDQRLIVERTLVICDRANTTNNEKNETDDEEKEDRLCLFEWFVHWRACRGEYCYGVQFNCSQQRIDNHYEQSKANAPQPIDLEKTDIVDAIDDDDDEEEDWAQNKNVSTIIQSTSASHQSTTSLNNRSTSIRTTTTTAKLFSDRSTTIDIDDDIRLIIISNISSSLNDTIDAYNRPTTTISDRRITTRTIKQWISFITSSRMYYNMHLSLSFFLFQHSSSSSSAVSYSR